MTAFVKRKELKGEVNEEKKSAEAKEEKEKKLRIDPVANMAVRRPTPSQSSLAQSLGAVPKAKGAVRRPLESATNDIDWTFQKT